MIAPEPPPTPQTVITRTPYSLVHSLTPGRDYPSLLTPLVHLLPPSPADAPLTLTIWTEDNAFRIPSERILAKSRELARRGLGESDNTALPWVWFARICSAGTCVASPFLASTRAAGAPDPRSIPLLLPLDSEAKHCRTSTLTSAGTVHCRPHTYGTQGYDADGTSQCGTRRSFSRRKPR
jgi:hypothetical protein